MKINFAKIFRKNFFIFSFLLSTFYISTTRVKYKVDNRNRILEKFFEKILAKVDNVLGL